MKVQHEFAYICCKAINNLFHYSPVDHTSTTTRLHISYYTEEVSKSEKNIGLAADHTHHCDIINVVINYLFVYVTCEDYKFNYFGMMIFTNYKFTKVIRIHF